MINYEGDQVCPRQNGHRNSVVYEALLIGYQLRDDRVMPADDLRCCAALPTYICLGPFDLPLGIAETRLPLMVGDLHCCLVGFDYA